MTPPQTPHPADPTTNGVSTAGLENLITAHQTALRQPGVLSVRPGYEITNGWLTGRRAIVATVEHKLADPPTGQALPEQIDGVPVDVRQASPLKRLSLTNPETFADEHRFAPNLGALPVFPDEHVFTSGGTLALAAAAHPAAHLPPKPSLPYTTPGVPLTTVTAPMSLQLAASPDNGWPTLRPFVDNTQTALTVGLYDFTSAHVLAAVQAALAGKTLTLVIDHPGINPTADQTDETTVADLHTTLGDHLTQAWALSRSDPLAAAWIYPYAYHIKVAVQPTSTPSPPPPTPTPPATTTATGTSSSTTPNWPPNSRPTSSTTSPSPPPTNAPPPPPPALRCPQTRPRPAPRRSTSSSPPPRSPTPSPSPRCSPPTPATTSTQSYSSSTAPPHGCTCNSNTSTRHRAPASSPSPFNNSSTPSPNANKPGSKSKSS